MNIKHAFVTFLFVILITYSLAAAGLSTTVCWVHSGTFPIINATVKIFSPEAVVLSKENFTLTEDGKDVKDFSITIAKPKQFYMLTMDRSSSIKADLPMVKQAVAEFLRSLPDNVLVGAISFGSDVQLEHDFSKDRRAIYAAVQKVRAWGGDSFV